MDVEQSWSVLESERRSLADLLSELTDEQWETGSLCSQWRVRDVAAHVAMTHLRLGWGTIGRGLVKARGDLWAFGRDVARGHAQRPTDAIVAELRDHAAARTMPALTNLPNIAMDVLVHGQDITIPLGIDRPMPPAAAVAGFERVWTMGWPFHARKKLRGLRLIATDAQIDVGSGDPVEGRIADLLLLATGRTAAAVPRLHGPGVSVLQA